MLPWFEFQAQQWHQGHFPMWDPYHWGGQSLIGQNQPGAAYPLNWLLFLAPLDHGHISRVLLNLYLPLIRFMAALFCYLLCRGLNTSRIAAVLAGTVFGFGGYIGTCDWPQMINGAVWAPLVLLYFRRSMGDPARLLWPGLSGAFLGLAFLSGHHQIPIYITLMLAGLWLYELFTDRERARQLILAFGTLGTLALLISALQMLPAYEYWGQSLRWVGAANPVGWGDPVPYSVHDAYSLNPVAVLGLILPGIHGSTIPYVGVAALSLAVAGAVLGWAERPVRVFTGIAVGGLLFALGSDSIFHGFLYATVPFIEKARSPGVAIFICHLGLAGLMAFGVDRLRIPESRTSAVTLGVIRTALAVAAVLYSILLWMWIADSGKTSGLRRLGLSALVCLLLAMLLAAWRRSAISNRAALVLMVLLTTFELGNVAGYAYPSRELGWPLLDRMPATTDLAEYLKRQTGPVRVSIDRTLIPFNFGDWYGIEQYEGYQAGLTSNIARIFADGHVQAVLGVNHWIGKAPIRPGWPQVFTGAAGWNIYRSPEAFARAWSVHTAESIQRPAVLERFQQPLETLRAGTFIAGDAPRLEQCPTADRIDLTQHAVSHVRIHAQMACKGMVILGDTFFPGWKATVDGQPAVIHEAYGVVRGVVVAAGAHEVDFRYRPWPVYLGAALTTLGLGILGALWTLDRRRRDAAI